MPKSHTKLRAGLLVAVYIQDGQGRRLVLADESACTRLSSVLERPMTIATNQREAKDAIAALHQLLEELPP